MPRASFQAVFPPWPQQEISLARVHMHWQCQIGLISVHAEQVAAAEQRCVAMWNFWGDTFENQISTIISVLSDRAR